MFERGVKVDLEKLLSRGLSLGKKTSLPTYPFQRQRHYPNIVPSRKNGRITSKPVTVPNGTTHTMDPVHEDEANVPSVASMAAPRKDKEDVSKNVIRIIQDVLELEPSHPIGQCRLLAAFTSQLLTCSCWTQN